ncbi:MAG: HD domain-containing protein [Chloroflexi bacterium]|nr:HD domain-containing protein [Chloroflexota bacterium]
MHAGHLKILKNLAESRNYGRGPAHAFQVSRLSLKIYDELVRLKLLSNNPEDRMILEASALLHDIGHPQEPHHEVGFDFLADEIPRLTSGDPISNGALSALLSSVLWHHERNYLKRGSIEIIDRDRTEKLAALIRVADGLDMITQPAIENIKLSIEDGRLRFVVLSKHPVDLQIEHARSKSDLMKKAFALQDIIFEHSEKHTTS